MKYFGLILVFLVAFPGLSQKEIQFIPPVKPENGNKTPRSPLINTGRDTLEIILDSNDRILFHLPNPQIREVLAKKFSERIALTASQQKELSGLDVFGCSFSGTSIYLDLGQGGRNKLMADTAYKGIPVEDLSRWLSVSRNALTAFSERKVTLSKSPNPGVSDFTPVYILKLGVHAKVSSFNKLNSAVNNFLTNNMSLRFYKVSKNGIEYTVINEPSYREHDFDLEGFPAPIYPEREKAVHSSVQKSAQFPGGAAALNAYIAEHKTIPAKVAAGKVSGKVYLMMAIDETGKIINIKVSQGLRDCLECNEEALRLVKAMPDWIPAQEKGLAVGSYYLLPISF